MMLCCSVHSHYRSRTSIVIIFILHFDCNFSCCLFWSCLDSFSLFFLGIDVVTVPETITQMTGKITVRVCPSLRHPPFRAYGQSHPREILIRSALQSYLGSSGLFSLDLYHANCHGLVVIFLTASPPPRFPPSLLSFTPYPRSLTHTHTRQKSTTQKHECCHRPNIVVHVRRERSQSSHGPYVQNGRCGGH